MNDPYHRAPTTATNFLQAFSGVYLTSGDVPFRVNGYLMDEGKLAVLCLLLL